MTRTKGRPRMSRPPKGDAAIYAALSERFRRGDLYAYSYESGVWSTWETLHDFDATKRNGVYRCSCVPRCNHGPTDWDRAELVDWLGVDERPKRTRARQPKVPTDHQGGSEIVQAIEAAYAVIREHHPELPAVVVVTGSGLDSYGLRWGHFARDRWIDALNEGRRPELFMAGERLACGAELTLQTLVHECVHGLACVRGVQDCSRQNRYHNRRFLAIAEEMGLTYPHEGPDATIGYSAVELTDTARKRYRKATDHLEHAVKLHLDNPIARLGPVTTGTLGGHGGRIQGGKRTRGTGGSSYVKAVCACEPARIIRISRAVLDGPAICCEACEKAFAA